MGDVPPEELEFEVVDVLSGLTVVTDDCNCRLLAQEVLVLLKHHLSCAVRLKEAATAPQSSTQLFWYVDLRLIVTTRPVDENIFRAHEGRVLFLVVRPIFHLQRRELSA